jgi:hypothetical protein
VPGVASEVDTTGPSITLRFSDGGTLVAPDAELRITLEDEHGINLTGHTIPNAITLTLDEKTRYNLTEGFRYDPGSYRRGTLLFRLPGVAPGGHSIVVTAADNFAAGIQGRINRSRAEIGFDVATAGGVPFARVLNFPNPFHGGHGTQFVLTGLSRPSDVEVRVFTVSGTRIRTLKGSGGPGSVQIGWDGYDESGAQAAVGVYPYKVVIRPQGGFLGTEQLDGRCAIMP